ncbi:Thiol-disulfide oxidoreductase ResA [anaerobic digester metagenome]
MNPKRKLSILLVLVVATLSCSEKETREEENNVTLLFYNAPNQKYFHFPSGAYSAVGEGTIEFVGLNETIESYTPKSPYDTLTIPCFGQNKIVISHKYKGLEWHDFLIQKGDSIKITYNTNGFPILTSNISNELTRAYNALTYAPNRISAYGFEPQTLIKNIMLNYIYEHRNKPNSPFAESAIDMINMDSVRSNLAKYSISINNYIDSLGAHKIVTPEYIEFYKLKSKRLQNAMNFKFSANKSISNASVTNAETEHAFAFADSLIHNLYYQRMLENYLHKVEMAKTNVSTLTTSNSFNKDYTQVFINIKANTAIPPKSKTALLYKTLDMLCENFPSSTKELYYNDFINFTKDTLKAHQLQKKHELYFEKSNSLLLEAPNGEETTLNQIIEKEKGNVIYITFESTWCKPCIQESIAAQSLYPHFTNRPITFVNIITWDTKENWAQHINKTKAESNVKFYFSTNSKTSRQLEALGVKSIPHFILINRQGIIVNGNAPRPSDKKTRELLTQLLQPN